MLTGMPHRILNKTQIREWREYRGLTQEALASRLEMSAANLSRIETGKQPYNQETLEAIAEALRCEAADLVMRHPPGSEQHDLWAVVRGLSPEQRKQAVRVLKALGETAA